MDADSLRGLSLGIIIGRRTILNVGDCHIPQLARSVITNRRQFSTSVGVGSQPLGQIGVASGR
jgi:hypothetical protein